MARQPRSKKIYRERSSVALFFKIIGILILALLILFMVIFFWFQRYIVYSGDGLQLEIPFLQFLYEDEVTPAPAPSPSVSMVIDENENLPEEVQNTPQENNIIKGIEVESLDGVDAEELLSDLDGANAIYVEMKNTAGELMYLSGSEAVIDFDITVGPDISGNVDRLKEGKVYLTAYISCFADDTFAARCPSAALTGEDGEPYTDQSNVRWLNPQSEKTVSYISDICRELSELGFDEIVLKDFALPMANSALDGAEILVDFVSELKSAMGRVELSVFCGNEVFTGEEEALITIYSDVFYRIYVDGENQEAALTAAEPVLAEDMPHRLVIVTDGDPVEGGSWIISG